MWPPKLLRGFAIFLWLFISASGFSQNTPWNGQRSQWISSQTDTQLDSLTVLPYSLDIRSPDGVRLDTSFYHFSNNMLFWQNEMPFDSLLVRYRVLPFLLEKPLQLIDSSQLNQSPEGILIGTYNPYANSNELPRSKDLNYSGSFSRGISFGNRQDLVLNSSFNLQMAGEIGDGIKISAAISDENLPIQPEGNTRQLRDFDRIFIQLEKGRSRLTAGDYELQNPDGYFLQYFKKLEGATFQSSQQLSRTGIWEQSASVAIARGNFRRQLINAIEGNQGPYKLQGASGELFIIILSGTEKVFIDGKLLQRGRDADYIIDYNQGEITFMARQLITKDSRISVEFEYADQRYLRSLYAANTRYKTDKWSAYVNLYSQQDSRTATGDLELSEEEKMRLREAGDQSGETFISTISPLNTEESQRATYIQIDSIISCSGADIAVQFLRYSTAPDTPKFTASFARVDAGQGNYILDTENLANERVYKWISPDENCQPQGNYEPIRQLAAPKSQRMITAGGQYNLGHRGAIQGELAYSQEDLNRFSSLDNNDDNGLAGNFRWNYSIPLQKDSLGWALQTNGQYEQLQANFKAINPFRSAEFLRDWNLATINGIGNTTPALEKLGQTGLRFSKKNRGEFGYRFSFFDRQNSYEGKRHEGNFVFNKNDWLISGNSSWLNGESATEKNKFWRPKMAIAKTFEQLGGWQISAEGQAEKSERYALNETDLSPTSFFFTRYVGSISSPKNDRWSLQTSYRQRTDFSPQGAQFLASTKADEGELKGEWQTGPQWRMGGLLTFRNLAVIDTALSTQESAKTLLGRIDMNGQWAKGAIRSGTTYEIGSGQEARIEYTYLFVGAGQGQYIWLDSLYNNDGQIQANEMEIAPFQDIGDHIRISIFTDDFIRTDNVSLNQSLQLAPSKIWRSTEKKWQRLLAKMDWQSSLSIVRKARAFEGVQTWNPLQLDLPDTALVAVTANQRHSLFFNRRSTNFDVQLEYTRLQRRLVPTTGFESRLQQSRTLRFRLKITDASTFRLASSLTQRTSDSEFFNNKDFDLQGGLIKPSINYQPGQDYSIQLSYQWLKEANQIPLQKEVLQRQEFALEGNYQQWLRLSFSYIDIALEGDARSPVGFALLNGLQPGKNILWNAGLTRQVGQYLQMTFSYEGRKTGEAKVVHVGRASVTAIF